MTRMSPRLEHKTLSLYENIWLIIGVLIQVLLFVAVLVSLVSGTSPLIDDNKGGHNHLAGVDNGQVDPTNLQATVFGKPGLYRDENGNYSAIVVAKAFAFEPAVLKVPVGERINFHVTAADVVHGYYVHGTNINVDLMPGQVSSFSTTFDTPGKHNVICFEYCGVGHHNMINELIVLGPGEEVPLVNDATQGAEQTAETVSTPAPSALSTKQATATTASATALATQEATP